MSDDLVKRLRARADMHVAATPATMLHEAAARIEADAARIRELEAAQGVASVLERIVWSAMVWGCENPCPDEVPEYPDGGNSFAETEGRATVQRIRSALTPAPETVEEAARVLAEAMENRQWAYYPVPMPVTNDGRGPATIGEDATGVVYEVWERQCLISISSHEFLPDAIAAALRAIAGQGGE